MAVKLAALEAVAVFAAVCATLLWPAPGGLFPRVPAGGGLAFAVCSLLTFYYSGLYDLTKLPSFGRWAWRLPRAFSVALLPLLAGQVLLPASPVSHGAFAASVLTALVLVLVVRAGTYRLLESRPLVRRVLIVGDSWLAQELVNEIHARPALRQRIVGMLDNGGGALPARCRRLGGLRDLAAVVEKVRPHRLIVALAARRGHMPLKALLNLRLSGIAVEDGADVYEKLSGKIAIEALTPSSLIFCKDYRAFRLDLFLARALGVPVMVAALLLLAPLFGLIALAIKLDSPGPVFFIQERVGRRGRLFRLIKFRTMHPARCPTSEWARDNSGRLTRVGSRLRRFRLDELPQLVNVIKGDMNLVGPRPHPVSNFTLFAMVARNAPECGEPIPYCALRSLVRPGITGWAQVRYRYANDLEEEIEKIRYDLYYIKHMSLWLDLRILFETVKIVLRGRESPSDEAAGRIASRPPAVRTDRPPLRLAAEIPPSLDLGLASPAPASGAVSEYVAPSAPGATLVNQDSPKA